MQLNNSTQRNAWKQALKEIGLADGKIGKRLLTKKLAHPAKGAYRDVSSAKKFVKDLVDADEVDGSKNPVDDKGSFVVRKDIRKEVSL